MKQDMKGQIVNVCPYCGWPLHTSNELKTHIEIKHKGGLHGLLQQIQEDVIADDELLDDGVYIDDVVIHAPRDDDDDD